MRFSGRLLSTAFLFISFHASIAAATPAWKSTPVDLGIQNEGRIWSFSLTDWIVNPQNAALRFEATGLPSWMQLNGATGALSGTPDRDGVGTYDGIRFTLISGTTRLVATAKGEVVKTLSPPRWTQAEIDLSTAREGFPYTQALTNYVENKEKALLFFEIVSSTPPTWMVVGQTTGAVSGTPTAGTAGDVKLRIKLSANIAGRTYQDTALIRLKVVAVNRPPTWKADPLILPSALSGRAYEQNLASSVTDQDGETLLLKIVSGPAWAKLDAQGRFGGTSQNSDAGKNEWIVEATDGSGTRATTHVRVQVAKTNEAPKWQAKAIALRNAKEGVPYQVDLTPYASDPDADILNFRLLDGPDWLQVAAGGAVIGVPGRRDVGPVKLQVRVDDGKGGNALVDFSFFVDGASHPPQWTLNPLVSRAVEGAPYKLDLSPYLVNEEGGPISYGMVQTMGWGTLSAAGVFSGTPSAKFVGKNTFQFRATTVSGAGATVQVWIDVEAINHAPIWTSVTVPDATENAPYQTSVAQFAQDADKGDFLVFSKVGTSPSWLSVSESGILSGTPNQSNVGAQSITVRATDSKGEVAQSTIALKVNGINHAPRWRQKTVILGNAYEGSDFVFNLALYAADEDGDVLRFDLVQGPSWLRLLTDGTLSGRPTRADVGPFQAVLRARDATQWVDVAAVGEVRRQNRAPQLLADWPVFQVKERETLSGTLNLPANIVDTDADTLTFNLKQTVPWLKVNADGSFTASPQRSERGQRAFAFSVDDGKEALIGAIRFEVLPNPRPPLWLVSPINRIAMTHETLMGSLAPQVLERDGLTMGFTKTAGKNWLTVNSDGTFSGTPLETDVGENTFEVLACNEDKSCAPGTLVVEVQKGLASDRVQLGAPTAGASTEMVFLIDPSAASKDLAEAVQQAIPSLQATLRNEGVRYNTVTLHTNAGQTPPSGIQSPLWTFYTWATSRPEPEKPVTDALIVTRQEDGLKWFTNQYASHQGVQPLAYIQQMGTNSLAQNRSVRVSAIAPSCKGSTAVGASYKTWVERTGGLSFLAPCTPRAKEWVGTWGQGVRFWAQMLAKKQIVLSRPPLDPKRIEVSVGGAVLPKSAALPAWRYEAATQSVWIDWSRIDKRALKATDWLELKYLARE